MNPQLIIHAPPQCCGAAMQRIDEVEKPPQENQLSQEIEENQNFESSDDSYEGGVRDG